jgi:hypothetical protein
MNEYKAEDLTNNVAAYIEEDYLNGMAEEGWELVTIVTHKELWHGKKRRRFRFFFKREKKDE